MAAFKFPKIDIPKLASRSLDMFGNVNTNFKLPEFNLSDFGIPEFRADDIKLPIKEYSKKMGFPDMSRITSLSIPDIDLKTLGIDKKSLNVFDMVSIGKDIKNGDIGSIINKYVHIDASSIAKSIGLDNLLSDFNFPGLDLISDKIDMSKIVGSLGFDLSSITSNINITKDFDFSSLTKELDIPDFKLDSGSLGLSDFDFSGAVPDIEIPDFNTTISDAFNIDSMLSGLY